VGPASRAVFTITIISNILLCLQTLLPGVRRSGCAS
jgi:hypothetical protein